MSLNDAKIRSLKPSAKPFKVSDSHGLYLLVNPGGSRLWYLKYRINVKNLVIPGIFQRYAQEHPQIGALAKQEIV